MAAIGYVFHGLMIAESVPAERLSGALNAHLNGNGWAVPPSRNIVARLCACPTGGAILGTLIFP